MDLHKIIHLMYVLFFEPFSASVFFMNLFTNVLSDFTLLTDASPMIFEVERSSYMVSSLTSFHSHDIVDRDNFDSTFFEGLAPEHPRLLKDERIQEFFTNFFPES